MFYQVLVVASVLGIYLQPTNCANILAFFPLPIYSHISGFNPLFLELADRGHHVTVVSAFQPKGNVPSTYKHVTITNVKISRVINPLDIRNTYRLTNMINVKKNMMNMVRRTLALKDTQEFLNDTQYTFDLVLSECWYSDAYLAVGHRYSAPVVCLSPMMPSATLSAALGSPNNPSFVPSFWLHYSDVMSFGQRVYNALITSAEMLMSAVVLRDAEQELADTAYTYPGHDRCPPLDALRRAVALTLVNSHYSVSYSRPYPPNFVSVAGMHMRPQQLKSTAVKVEPKLKALIDGATDGIIYFSFGSNIKMSDLPERYVRMFVESFRKLPQKVLWKWENGSIDNAPDNVYVASWFPQQYILSHKNCKLFITHGGYHSLVEALHVGLPLIGFPFFTDQYYNMKFVVENGFGVEINLNDLSVNVLDDAIGKILFDTSYKEHAQRASEIFLDLPLSALDTAVYWIEYVIRNGPNLRSTLQAYGLNWYQYFLLDVMVSIIGVSVLIAFIFYTLIKYVYKLYVKNNVKIEKKLN